MLIITHSKTEACMSEIAKIFGLACIIQEVKNYIYKDLKFMQ